VFERAHAQLEDKEAADVKSQEPHAIEEPPWGLSAFTNQSLHFLLGALATRPDACASLIRVAGLRGFGSVLAAARRADSYFLAFCSSEAEDEVPGLRTRGVPLVCWCDDASFPEVETYAFRRPFADMARAHHH
jgi:hypothetical protein